MVSKKFIPVILILTIVVAGVFAFIPVQEAATVHTIVMANTMRIDQILVPLTGFNTTPNLDLVITCPDDSDGCKILELYMQEADAEITDDGDDDDGGGDIDLGLLSGVINGVNTTIQGDLGTQVSNTQQAIAGLSGTVFGGGDTITIQVVDASSASVRYNAIIFIEVEGNQSATAAFQ